MSPNSESYSRHKKLMAARTRLKRISSSLLQTFLLPYLLSILLPSFFLLFCSLFPLFSFSHAFLTFFPVLPLSFSFLAPFLIPPLIPPLLCSPSTPAPSLLESEPRARHMLDKYFMTKLHQEPCVFLFFFYV